MIEYAIIGWFAPYIPIVMCETQFKNMINNW